MNSHKKIETEQIRLQDPIPTEFNPGASGGYLYADAPLFKNFLNSHDLSDHQKSYVQQVIAILSAQQQIPLIQQHKKSFLERIESLPQKTIYTIMSTEYAGKTEEEDEVAIKILEQKGKEIIKIDIEELREKKDELSNRNPYIPLFARSELEDVIKSKYPDDHQNKLDILRDQLTQMQSPNPIHMDKTLGQRSFRHDLNLQGLGEGVSFELTSQNDIHAQVITELQAIFDETDPQRLDEILQKYVSKVDGTFSGKGVAVKTSTQKISNQIEGAMQAQNPGKVTLEPLYILPELDEQGLNTLAEGMYSFDTRIRIAIADDGKFNFDLPLVRGNLKGKPCNIGSGGFFAPSAVTTNENYIQSLEKINTHHKNMDISELNKQFSDFVGTQITIAGEPRDTRAYLTLISSQAFYNHLITAISGYMQIRSSTGSNPKDIAMDSLGPTSILSSNLQTRKLNTLDDKTIIENINTFIQVCMYIKNSHTTQKNEEINKYKELFLYHPQTATSQIHQLTNNF